MYRSERLLALRRVGRICVGARSATSDHWSCLLRALPRVHRINPKTPARSQQPGQAKGLGGVPDRDRLVLARVDSLRGIASNPNANAGRSFLPNVWSSRNLERVGFLRKPVRTAFARPRSNGRPAPRPWLRSWPISFASCGAAAAQDRLSLGERYHLGGEAARASATASG
jgi:hypothetical protein